MTVADDLQQARAALTMIHGEPFNAEAPPEALTGDITPTELHYVRSNFAVPVHDGTLEIGGAVEHPRTLTLDDLRAMPPVERVVTLECAGNGRLRCDRCRPANHGVTTPSPPLAGPVPCCTRCWSTPSRPPKASRSASPAPTTAPTCSIRSSRH